MSKIPVFIDCDPGVDDIFALFLAMNMPEIDVVGISTVCGNVECDKTFVNARKVVAMAGRDIPVYKGADAPLFKELVTAANVHGEDGMRGFGAAIPLPDKEPEKEKAWDALYREAKARPGELVLVAVGPMTNVAIALSKYKELPALLKNIVIMGGSVSWGNVTPAAEFNIYVDPEAAEMTFKCGAKICMFGLDVTEKAVILPSEVEEIGKMQSKPAQLIYNMCSSAMEFYLAHGSEGPYLHDPCAVMYIAYPELFSGKMAGVCVESKGRITRGKTVCDMFTDVKFPFQNTLVMTDVNREEFVKKVIEIMGRY